MASHPSVFIAQLPTMHPALGHSTDATPTSSPITMSNPSTDAFSGTPDACHIIAMGRTDSGFGENPATPDSSSSRASSIMVAERGKVRPGRPQKRRSRKSVVSEQSPLELTKPPAGSAGTTSPEPTTPERASSQMKPRTPGSDRSSKSSSRRSSFLTQQAPTHNKRRPICHRSMSTTGARSAEDPILLYQRSKSLFESPPHGLEYLDHSAMLSQEPLTSSLPCPPRASTATNDLTDGLLANKEENSVDAYQYSNHMPATIIDWTLPSTRRREYRKIESTCRGIPGLWRRFAPRFFQRNRRLSFYEDEKDDDTGSVRRYRLDLPEDEDEKTRPVVKTNGSRLSLNKVKRSWSCIGSFKKAA